jgi:AraC family transcriptional regulator
MEGSTLFERTVAEVRVSVTSYAAGAHIDGHVHPLPYISAVLSGSYTEINCRKPQYCAPSRVLFHPAGERHADHMHAGPARCLNLEFLSGWTADALHQLRLANAASQVDRILALLQGDRLELEGSVVELLALLKREIQAEAEEAEGRRWMDKAYHVLAEVSSGGAAPITEAAKRIGVHRTHFWRRCRLAGGPPPRDLIIAARTRMAAERLILTDTSLARVAAECGFFDQAHFTRQFKMNVGMTPSDFRKWFVREREETRIQYAAS